MDSRLALTANLASYLNKVGAAITNGRTTHFNLSRVPEGSKV